MWAASRALDVVEKLWQKIGGARERALGVRADGARHETRVSDDERGA